MPKKGKIVVLRFSAMGDVAMVASVLREFCEQHAEAEIIMVSRENFQPFFEGLPNLTFHPILPKTVHKGFLGLFKLFSELIEYQPIAIADLHDNLRSRIISTFFRLKGIKIDRINKGRSEKRKLTRDHHKILRPLKQTVERYADVFRNLGFSFQLKHQLIKPELLLPLPDKALFEHKKTKYIGISPFAQHLYKIYDLQKMEEVIEQLNSLNYQLFIFGGGKEEERIATTWEGKYQNVKNLIGKFTLKEELAIIAHLDVMVSMDSAGMHMASLMGVPAISIWGPTHPYAGFLGYGQQLCDCIQIDHPNRPNSIYGNKPCLCGETPCIDLIKPVTIVNQIIKRLSDG